jgi:hypothetical protein
MLVIVRIGNKKPVFSFIGPECSLAKKAGLQLMNCALV